MLLAAVCGNVMKFDQLLVDSVRDQMIKRAPKLIRV
jgi:hypothetical protein